MDGSEGTRVPEDLGSDLVSSFREFVYTLGVSESTFKEFSKIFYIVLAIIFIAVTAFVVYVIVQALTNKKILKLQNMHFKETLNLITKFQNVKSDDSEENASLPEGEAVSQEQLKVLTEQCEQLGYEVDEHTDRHGNSKTVSELVYKLSLVLGLDSYWATVYFCASLVYDAGFLDLPGDLFRQEILSSAEKHQLKTHVMRGVSYCTFVPEQIADVFMYASMLHHENINGTGYPEGLRGEAIPQIARILRVVESYVSLVSHRRYHQLRDKQSAIKELRRQPGIYDSDIVDALEQVI